ncbi:MAG: potassium/proton antiporter [Alphaproteobacteria bacterium]|nr:MAG: potassium/proton antiporter [Alphaproteobacteria bacterium]
MTGPELIALGHAAIARAHELILLGGALGLLSIIAGLISRRVGAPMLLVFLALGMLAGEDGVLGIPYDDFTSAYLIGSVALAVILLEGGLKTPIAMLRLAFWPAAVLATIGVAVTAAILGIFVSLVDRLPLIPALLAGSAAAPTDAAAVAVLLRRAGAALPERLHALLEVESGLNDPMSVFLTILLLRLIAEPGSVGIGEAALMFLEEMVGGAVIGLAGGWVLAQLLKRLRLEGSLAPVLVLTGGLAVFGLAQLLGTSGFLATYLAAIVTGATRHRTRQEVEHFFEGMAWLAQIVLFLMLGLLVTPHDLPPYLPGAIIGAAVLIFLARPIAVFACLIPFGFTTRETAFASWVGLRGAVPIYLSIIPGLVDPNRDKRLFASIFIVVIASLLVQGWTVGLSARLLGFARRPVS